MRYLVGRAADCDLQVLSPRVSARHAEVRISGTEGWLRDLGSRYGTLLNNRRVSDWESFGPADRIVVGNSELQLDTAGQIQVRPAHAGATVCAAGLGFAVNRGRKQLLRNISFVVKPGEMVALMGPSGAGKSTMLKTLVGIFPPSWGTVLLNSVNMSTDPERARQAVGYVPQDDIVHADLKVKEALRYGATIRLPLDTTPDEMASRIAFVLGDLEIKGTADVIIGSAERAGISGGQRKRVNLALELLPQPPLLLLDEPTSGLSSEDATNVFGMLRELADDGHTIIVTTHQPSLEDFKRFDHVIFLMDGELVYFGPAWPDSASYFASMPESKTPAGSGESAWHAGTALAELNHMKRQGVKAKELAQRYEKSHYYQTYVAGRLGSLEHDATRRSTGVRLMDSLRQLGNQIGRYALLKARNRGSLPVQLAQAPAIAILLSLVLSSNGLQENETFTQAKLLFFMAVAAVWFGCSNAAREIVGEKPILMRERMVGLDVGPYVLSKLLVLGALSALQCAVMLALTHLWYPIFGSLHVPNAWRSLAGFQYMPAELWLLWLCSMVGVLMGLTLSALARTTETALSATPLFLIPEILLSGQFEPVVDLKCTAPAHGIFGWFSQQLPCPGYLLSHLTATRWAFEGLLVSDNLKPLHTLSFGEVSVPLWQSALSLSMLGLVYGCILLTTLALTKRDG
jgi:ABC transport system ATP-binding/permease protein